jgi:alpha-N-acetylglucosaminidase
MVGTGFTQEGLALTYPTVDILSEMSWRKSPITNLDKWFEDYSTRRYGRQNPLASQAWKAIYADVFNSYRSDTSNVLTHLPDFNMTDDITYDKHVIVEGFDLMVFAVQHDPEIANQETFR